MSTPPSTDSPRFTASVSPLLLVVSVGLLGYLARFPDATGIFLAVGAVVVGVVLRRPSFGSVRAYASLPVLAAMAIEVVSVPVGLGSELIAGLAGLAFLLWLADDPARPRGSAARALPALAVTTLALGIAWSSALFLPSHAIPLGVAGGLLALAIAVVALLVGHPTVLDREEA